MKRQIRFFITLLTLSILHVVAHADTPLRFIKKKHCLLREIEPNKGFEIITLSQTQPHVLARIPRGNLMRAMQNPLFQRIVECYNHAPKVGQDMTIWRDAGTPDRVEPLLTDRWHQFAPYNMFTPTINGQHCATGCVAHALAQILRYHRYASGRGSYSYTDSAGCGQQLTAIFPDDGYDFAHMPDQCHDNACSPLQQQAVAKLLRDCGVWMHMKYGVEASSAAIIRQPMALANLLGYSRGLQMYFRDFFTYSDWVRMLRHELACGRPVLMLGVSASLSHAFCCDGYDEKGLFHLNLGMAGDADGFYYLPYLTPKQPEWYDDKNPEGGMNLIQAITIGIRPPNSQETNGKDTECHSFGMECIKSLTPNALKGDTLKVVTQKMGNIGWNTHQDEVVLMLKQNGAMTRAVKHYNHSFNLSELVDTTYTDTLSFVLPHDLKDGTYHLVAAFAEPQNKWSEVRTTVGTPNFLVLQIKGDNISLKTDSSKIAKLQVEDWHFPDTIIQKSKPPFRIDLRVDGSDYCGRFYVVLSPVDNDKDMRIIQMQGLTLKQGELTTRTFERTWVGIPTGTYNLRIAYDHSMLSDSISWTSNTPLQKVEVIAQTTGIKQTNTTETSRYIDLTGKPISTNSGQGLYIKQNGNSPARKILKQQNLSR